MDIDKGRVKRASLLLILPLIFMDSCALAYDYSALQGMDNNDEELLKWAKSMKSWQRVLVDSARFAAWHNVRTPLVLPLPWLPSLPSLNLPFVPPVTPCIPYTAAPVLLGLWASPDRQLLWQIQACLFGA